MAVVIRMKNVSRALIFIGSLIVWVVLLTVANDAFLGLKNEYILLLSAGFVGLAQTWIVAMMLHT